MNFFNFRKMKLSKRSKREGPYVSKFCKTYRAGVRLWWLLDRFRIDSESIQNRFRIDSESIQKQDAQGFIRFRIDSAATFPKHVFDSESIQNRFNLLVFKTRVRFRIDSESIHVRQKLKRAQEFLDPGQF